MGIDRIIASYAVEAKIFLVRGILWAALRQKHPELSIDEVGAMIGSCGLPHAKETMEALLLAAMPDPEKKSQKKRATASRAKAGSG